MKRIVFSILCVLLSSVSGSRAMAQRPLQYAELDAFRDSSEYMSVLYRGKQATRYLTPANGHIYWETPEFGTGDIVFEGRYYSGVRINFDAMSQEVLVLAPSNTIPVALPCSKVDRFSIGGKKFVNPHANGIDLPGEMYEILHEGKITLYKNVTKLLRFNAGEMNELSLGYDDPTYRYEQKSYYEYLPSYYISKDGRQPVRIKNKLAFRRYLREYRRQIRECVSEYENNMMGVYFDEYATIVLDYIDQ